MVCYAVASGDTGGADWSHTSCAAHFVAQTRRAIRSDRHKHSWHKATRVKWD